MSGSNPFRRKQAVQDVGEASGIRPLGIEIPAPTSRSRGKRVRIISPHSAITFDSSDDASISADDLQQYNAIPTTLRSPPPAGSLHSILSKGRKVNPFDLELSESSDEEDSPLTAVQEDANSLRTQDSVPTKQPRDHSDNPRRSDNGETSGNQSGLELEGYRARNDGIPTKKFAERLSSLSPSISGQEQSPRGSPLRTTFPDQTESSAGAASGQRTPMDVDAFKRLLLTGAKDPVSTTSGPTSTLGQQSSQGDSSSSTDTSSLSRNSILDSQTDLRLETPDSSHDITPLDEDGYSFSNTKSRAGRNEPPPPPRRRGSDLGKSHSTRGHGGQTMPTLSKPNIPIPPRPLSVITDLNKSLPARPPPEVAPFGQPDSPLTNTFTSVLRPRSAPPPPLSRRNSQIRAKQQQFHGVTASIAEEAFPPLESVHPPPPAINKAPAPPPPRRKGSERTAIIPTVPMDPTILNAEASSGSEMRIDQTPLRGPPPPPMRSGSRAKASKPFHTPSVSRSATIPPPPPSRHRASSGSSHASKRESTEVTRPSEENLQMASQSKAGDEQPKAPKEQKDILADLSALQKELDAYRTTFGS